MGELIDLNAVKDSQEPHKVSEVVCLNCKHRWIAVRHVKTLLKELQCPHRGCRGFAIETGEIME